MIFDRLKHHTKLLVGGQLEKILSVQYLRGQGPASRLISVYSEAAKQIGVEQNTLITPIPVKKLAPDFSLDGDIETEYRRHFLDGPDLTSKAGIFSARNVDVSFPTGMHQIGKYILKEVLPAPYVLTNPKYYFGLESMYYKRKRLVDEGILLSMPWHHNFYHWMIEVLPRLVSYDRCPSLQHLPLIVPKSASKFVAESLRLTGHQSKSVFLEDGVYRFKKLHMLSVLSSTMDVSPDALDWLNKKIVVAPSSLVRPKRIYVSRCDAKIRFISNEPLLADVLSEFGFETIVMSKLPLADQIDVFRAAECIIGPHGAAFTNLAFSKPGAIFIEFFSKGHFSPSFNRIAAVRKLKYGFLVGEPTRIGGFSINPNHLRAILSQALQQPT